MSCFSHQSLAMDLLLPGVGEVVGGSMREERLDVLKQKLQRYSLNLEKSNTVWYHLKIIITIIVNLD